MPIPHTKYNPPSGTVEVLDKHGQPDANWTWDGKNFRHRGNVHKPKHGDHIVGRPGTVMEGWTWDWHLKAWMQPDAPIVVHSGGALTVPPPPPGSVARQYAHQEGEIMNCHPHQQQNILDGLKNHWATPLLGFAIMVVSDFMTEPAPPAFPPGMTDDQKDFYMMQYNKNLVRFQGYQRKLDKWGGVVLGIGTANAAISTNGMNVQQHLQQPNHSQRQGM